MKNISWLIAGLFLMLHNTYAEQAKKPVMLESTIDSDSASKSSTFTPLDNSFRFRVDSKEINNINASDLKSLQEKVNTIKSNVLDAKSKIMEINSESLKDKNVDVALAFLVIKHKDEMSSRFNLLNLTYILDGEKIYSEYDLFKNKREEFIIYDSMVSPGNHEIIIQAVYSGNAEGVFDYLNDYRVKISDRTSVIIKDGVKLTITGIGYETGKIFTSFKDRPGLKFESKIETYKAKKIGK